MRTTAITLGLNKNTPMHNKYLESQDQEVSRQEVQEMKHSCIQNTMKSLKLLTNKTNNLFDFVLIGFITAELQIFGKKRTWKKNVLNSISNQHK